MSNPVSGFFLKRYENRDYLTRKKAGLVLFFAIAVAVILNLGTLLSLIFISAERAETFFESAIGASSVSLVSSHSPPPG